MATTWRSDARLQWDLRRAARELEETVLGVYANVGLPDTTSKEVDFNAHVARATRALEYSVEVKTLGRARRPVQFGQD